MKQMEKRFRDKRGITLIALIITIIVILILAGISIVMITGNNSILNKAGESRVGNALGAAKDEVSMKAQAIAQEYFLSIYNGNTESTETGTYSKSELDSRIMEGINSISTVDVSIKKQNDKNWDEANKKIILRYNPDRSTIVGRLDNGVITWEGITYAGQKETEDIEEDDAVRIYVTNNNDEIHIVAEGDENIKNVSFMNSNNEVVMNRTNKQETNTFEFTTKMTYAGNYTVKAYDIQENESQAKSFTVATDRELTYVYNKGTISSLASNFKVGKIRNDSYSTGTLTKQTDNLYFSRNCGNSQWAYSGFFSTSAIDVSDYTTLTFKFKPTSYMTSSNSTYPQASQIYLGLNSIAPSNSMGGTGPNYGFVAKTRLITPGTANSTLYLNEDHYDVNISEAEGLYYVGLATIGAMWSPQTWYLYCTEIYLH